MNKYTHQQTVLFPTMCDRDVFVVADEPATSSDGGALLLRTADTRLGLSDAFAACIPDLRQAGKVEHSIAEMLLQRIIGLGCGYEDANDAARLRNDPIHATIVRGDSADARALSSQPTLSRFENRVDTETNDTLALFYGTWCYQSLLGFVRFDDEKEQHLVAAALLPGTGSAVPPTLKELFWLIPMLRTYFPEARLCVRLDAGFASPAMLEELKRHQETCLHIHRGLSRVQWDAAVAQTNNLPPKIRTPHETFIALWYEQYMIVLKRKYKFQSGKDGQAVKQLLATKASPEELISVARAAWLNPCGFRCKHAATISGFNSQFNDIVHELATPDKSGKPTSDQLKRAEYDPASAANRESARQFSLLLKKFQIGAP